MKRKFPLFLLLILVYACSWAQTREVTGKVTKQGTSENLVGVTVAVKGTNTISTTTSEGQYRINVPGNNAVLVFSFVGHKNQELTVGNRTTIDVSLAEESSTLNDVVVVGYQTVRRRDLTGSVSSVSARQLKDIPINSTAEALAGRLAGVQVTSSEGSPNATAIIRVRGGGSITQDNSPLYIVDGVQVENALTVIAPQDIESIDVLKDASATAIYGARGANGVVIITTKGGKAMKTTVNYNGLFGFRQLPEKLDVMKPYDFVLYQYDRSRGSTAAQNSFLNDYGTFQDLELYKDAPFVDWQEELFGRNAFMQTHNVSLIGGTEATTFNLSLTSNKEEGIMLGSEFDRKLVNFKLDHRVSQKLRVGFNTRYNNTTVDGAGTAEAGSSSVNRLRHSVKYRPILVGGQSLTDYDPDYANETSANSLSLVNPILLNTAEYRKTFQNVTNLNGYFSYNFNNQISFKTTVGFDADNQKRNVFNDTITNASKLNGSSQPIASINTINRTVLNNSNVLTYSNARSNTEFSSRHAIDVLLGHEIVQRQSKAYFVENRLFPIGITPERALGNMSLGTTPAGLSTSTELTDRIVSGFTRLNYVLDKKYLVTLTMRADGSSKFSQKNKWGYFPSASVAWRLSEENFMSNINNTVSDLKLRLSYGQAGNNRIDDFLYLTQFNANVFYDLNNQLITGYGPAGLANENLKWETTTARNIGLDAGFLKNRIQLSVDLYKNTTTDNLLDVLVPTTSGYTVQKQNVGATANKGVELQINATPIQNKDFTWNANFNISFNKNRIESLGPNQSGLVSSGWAGGNTPEDFTVAVGQSVGTMWGFVTDGFYTLDDFNYSNGVYSLKAGVPSNRDITAVTPQPGMLKFKDLDGNNNITITGDRTIIGSSQPKFFGGLNQQFTYKNFDGSVFLNFQYGNDILNANKLEFSSGYTDNSNLLAIMNDRWRNVNASGQVVTDPTELAKLNTNATIWSPLTSASSFYSHSWAVEDGSFLRINNITLGYTLPTRIVNKIKISKLRIYGTINNLAVFTNYSGYDPEVNTRRNSPLTSGVDYSAYPRSRAFIVGANLSL